MKNEETNIGDYCCAQIKADYEPTIADTLITVAFTIDDIVDAIYIFNIAEKN